jgi:hypothetical protein
MNNNKIWDNFFENCFVVFSLIIDFYYRECKSSKLVNPLLFMARDLREDFKPESFLPLPHP